MARHRKSRARSQSRPKHKHRVNSAAQKSGWPDQVTVGAILVHLGTVVVDHSSSRRSARRPSAHRRTSPGPWCSAGRTAFRHVRPTSNLAVGRTPADSVDGRSATPQRPR